MEWRAGSVREPWPSTLDVFDGAVYLARDPAKIDPVRLEFRHVAGPFASEAAWIAGMALEGCAQSAALLESLRNETVPLDVFLSSDRGANPTYQLGESMRLRFQTSRDAYAICFYLDSQGNGIVLFPTRYSGGAMVSAQSGLSLPGPRLPIDLILSEPPGQERIACYASQRDFTPDLPESVLAGDLRTLDPSTVATARSRLGGLPAAETAAAVIDVTVH